MAIQGYDLVGDVHGHADPLHRLLDKLDYTEVEGVFRHPERKMIFVGDFVDRGPQQREVLRIARSMCEAGVAMAVMGNHEFNAIGWAAQNNDGKFLRSHSEKNARQQSTFLRQIEEDSSDHQDAVGWFRSLPIWLDLQAISASRSTRTRRQRCRNQERALPIRLLRQRRCLQGAALR